MVLGYITNDSKRFHVFAANRVQKIREGSDLKQWHYVETKSNPADHASRGLNASRISASNWFTGPDFLWQDDIEYPAEQPQLNVDDQEIKKSVTLCTRVTKPSILKKFSNFSSWSSLVRAVARLKRRAKGVKSDTFTNAQERSEAKRFILQLCQCKELLLEKVPKNLEAFKDEYGTMRVDGRLDASTLSQEIRHPVILDNSSHVARLSRKGHAPGSRNNHE